jgi:polar amino acid transport system substrate-binding protein
LVPFKYAAGLAAMLLGMNVSAADEQVMKELVPTGRLRVGVAYAPAPTPIFVTRDGAGQVRGVARDLGLALGKALGVPVEMVAAATTGELTDACEAGTIDIGFMPADDERRKRLDFSPPYFVIESTYLVTAASGIQSMAAVDHAGVTVVGIAGSTTMRAAGRNLQKAKLVGAKSIDDAMAMIKSGSVQAMALTHDSLPVLQQQVPGSLILDGAFQVTGVAMALQKNHPAALAWVSRFVQAAKSDGLVRKAFDESGLTALKVAPQ